MKYLPGIEVEDRVDVLENKCQLFIAKFSAASFSENTGLTPRTPKEVYHLLNKGHGEIAFDAQGEPAAILLTPEIMTIDVQNTLITLLGYNEPEKLVFDGEIVELSGSWVPAEKRGQGHYRDVKKRVMRLLERYFPASDEEEDDTIVIASNSRKQPPALTAPENGQAPIPFDRYPLATTLVSFMPDEVHTTRYIPEDYEDIVWKSERQIADLIQALGRKSAGQKDALKGIEIDEPTVYVMMRVGYSIGKTISTNTNPELNYHLYTQNALSQPVAAFGRLEGYLFDLVVNSPVYKEMPDEIRNEYMSRAIKRINDFPTDPAYVTHVTPASRDRLNTLVVQQVLLDTLRTVNKLSEEKRVEFNQVRQN